MATLEKITEDSFVFRPRQTVKIRMNPLQDECISDVSLINTEPQVEGPYKTGCPENRDCYIIYMNPDVLPSHEIEYYICLGEKPGYSVWATGDNLNGQLGNKGEGDFSEYYIEVSGEISDDWYNIRAGGDSSVAQELLQAQWYSWGNNDVGQLGLNSYEPYFQYPAPQPMTKWRDIRILNGSPEIIYGLDYNYKIWVGCVYSGQTYYNHLFLDEVYGATPTIERNLTEIEHSYKWKHIHITQDIFIGLTTSNQLYGVGLNKNGELGFGHNNPITNLTKLTEDAVFRFWYDEAGLLIFNTLTGLMYSGGRRILVGRGFTTDSGYSAFAQMPNFIWPKTLHVVGGNRDTVVSVSHDNIVRYWGLTQTKLFGHNVDRAYVPAIMTEFSAIGCTSKYVVLTSAHIRRIDKNDSFRLMYDTSPFVNGYNVISNELIMDDLRRIWAHFDKGQQKDVILDTAWDIETMPPADWNGNYPLLTSIGGKNLQAGYQPAYDSSFVTISIEGIARHIGAKNWSEKLGTSHYRPVQFDSWEDFCHVGPHWAWMGVSATHGCAVDRSGNMVICGSNAYGQLGIGTTGDANKHKFELIDTPTKVRYVDCGPGFGGYIGLGDDYGDLYMAGLNTDGQLGLGHNTSPVTTFTKSLGIEGNGGWVICGTNHTIVWRTDGRVFTAGSNDTGQLGSTGRPTNYEFFPASYIIAGRRPTDILHSSSWIMTDGDVVHTRSDNFSWVMDWYESDNGWNAPGAVKACPGGIITSTGQVWVAANFQCRSCCFQCGSEPGFWTFYWWEPDWWPAPIISTSDAGDDFKDNDWQRCGEGNYDYKQLVTYQTPDGGGGQGSGIQGYLRTDGTIRWWCYSERSGVSVWGIMGQEQTLAADSWTADPFGMTYEWVGFYCINSGESTLAVMALTTGGTLYRRGWDPYDSSSIYGEYSEGAVDTFANCIAVHGSGQVIIDTNGDMWVDAIDEYDTYGNAKSIYARIPPEYKTGIMHGTYPKLEKIDYGVTWTDGGDWRDVAAGHGTYLVDSNGDYWAVGCYITYTNTGNDNNYVSGGLTNRPGGGIVPPSHLGMKPQDGYLWFGHTTAHRMGVTNYLTVKDHSESDCFMCFRLDNYSELAEANGPYIGPYDGEWTIVRHIYQDTQLCGSQYLWASCGDGFSAACSFLGELWVWGRNDYGQLGLGDTTQRDEKTQAPGGLWYRVVCGKDFLVAVNILGDTYAAGRNDKGQLGLGHTTSPVLSLTRVQYPFKEFFELFAGDEHCLATGDDYVWTDPP